jgi:uncharacterized protein YbaR (Trm112 family)
MALTLEKKIKNCISSLNLSQEEAGNILVSEFIRMAYDERHRDDKGITIQVKDDMQKIFAESMVQAYTEYTIETPLCQTGKGIVKVRVGNDSSEPEDSVNVINLENFDFETEKRKLIARYDETIICNAKIREYLIKEGVPVVSKPRTSGYQRKINDIETKIKKITTELVKYELSVFSIFKENKIRDCQKEIDSLKEELEMLQEKQREFCDTENKEDNESSRRIKNLEEKEETMKAIKFMFTGKRESLVKTINPDGKVTYNFDEDSDNKDERIVY